MQINKSIKTVKVSGEVYFNGVYPITEYQTLRELIERSGGLTNFASAKGAVFQREALRETEIKRFSEAQSEIRRKVLLSTTASGIGEKALDVSKKYSNEKRSKYISSTERSQAAHTFSTTRDPPIYESDCLPPFIQTDS